MRFFAAFLVVIAHGFEALKGYYFGGQFDSNAWFDYLNTFLENFGIGVEIFFFISGFLITYILLVEKEQTGQVAIGKFLIRRVLRIWPIYFLIIAITPFLIYWLKLAPPDYMAQLFFYGNFNIIQSELWQFPFAHFWSIALEEQFYFVWPFIIAFIPKKRLLSVFGALILVSILSRLYVFNYCPNSWNIYLNTVCRMDTIVIGALCAFLYHQYNFRIKLNNVIVVITIITFLTLLITTKVNSWANLSESLFKKYIYLIPFGLLVLQFIQKKKSKTSTRVFTLISYLGKISYGIYMFHNVLIIIIIQKILLNNEIYSEWIFLMIYFILTIVISTIVFEGFEKKFLRLKKHFTIVKTRKF